jgi:hypothetical protein
MDLFEQGDVRSIFRAGLATDDAELRPPAEVPGAGIYVGLDGLTEFMSTWTEDFDAWSLHTDRVLEAGKDEVVVFAGQRGRGKASGATAETFFGAVFTLQGSRIKRVQL